jgi:hypothetical protein
MKVQMLKSLAGVDFTLRKGEVYDLPDSRALFLLKQKLASAVKQDREVAVVEPKEKAVTDVQVNNTAPKRAVKPGRSKSTSKGNRH